MKKLILQNHLSMQMKIAIIFIDYIIFICIIFAFNSLTITGFEKDYFLLFWLFMYILYYVTQEYFFRRTLGMRLFKVSLKAESPDDFKKGFLPYSVLVIFDRFIILIFYLFSVLFASDKNLLLSEKYSGLRWKRNKPLM